LDLMVAPTSVVAGDALFTWNVDLLWVGAADRVPDPRQPLDLAAFGTTCPWRRRMVEALAASGRAYRIVLTSQSMTALQAGIECGLGIGLLPRDA
ncbi:LysR substrate-binding domain-containing protein, partial [Staphylococcus aureus]